VRNLIRVDRPAREHRRDGQAVELIKTLKGNFARRPAESVARDGGESIVKTPLRNTPSAAKTKPTSG
jgi:hypothetical protein